MTIGELSVSAIIPNRRWLTSGESSAETPPAQPRGSPAKSADNDKLLPASFTKARRRIVKFFCLEISNTPKPLAADMPDGHSGLLNAEDSSNKSDECRSCMSLPLDSRQLRAFITLARTGSFTLAAKELFLSQSAVSHSMRALEEEVGCRLLDRVGKKVLLTQAGETLLHHAEKILQEINTARSALEQLGKWGRDRLRIGPSTTACQYILPSVLREFKSKYPQSFINIEPADTVDALELLRSNRVDLAIVLEPKNEE